MLRPASKGWVSSISRDDRGQLEHLPGLNEVRVGNRRAVCLDQHLPVAPNRCFVFGVSVLRKHGRRNRPEVVARLYEPRVGNPSWLWWPEARSRRREVVSGLGLIRGTEGIVS